jgi:DNA polymerase-3 subunit delta
MVRDLAPEEVLKSLEKGELAPFYLFHGPGEFRLEKVLDKIRDDFIPAAAKDLNVEVIYGGEKTDPAEIINRARTIPFLASNRLIIIRRTEKFTANELEVFLPYLEGPAETTCLIFVSSKTDFKRKFYKRIRSLGRAVHFANLSERQVVPWIKRTAGELGLRIDGEACAYLGQIVGNSLRDLYAELEKLHLRYGEEEVGVEQVKALALHTRVYTIFELMNRVSEKNCAESLGVLNRFLEEEDQQRAPLQILGMLNRQIRLLWQTKDIVSKGGSKTNVAKNLGLPDFSARDFVAHSKGWSIDELERAIRLLYQADAQLKSGSRPKPILENVVFSLCRQRMMDS